MYNIHIASYALKSYCSYMEGKFGELTAKSVAI